MKRILALALSLFIVVNISAQEKELVVKTGPNLGSLSGDKSSSGSSYTQYPLFGWQLAAGVLFPFEWAILPCNGQWYYNPLLMWSMGGQGYKDGDYKFGERNTYINIPNVVGYRKPVKKNEEVYAEIGPSLNFWAGSKYFTKFENEKETGKIDLKSNDNVNRAYASVVVEGGYTWSLPRNKLSLGLRADFGLSPIEKYENFDGTTTSIKANSYSLSVGISNPFGDLLGKEKEADYGSYLETYDIDEELLSAENTYEKVRLAHRRARIYRDKSLSIENADSSKYYAEQAILWSEKGEKWLMEGIDEWDEGDLEGGVGPSSAKMLAQFMTEIKSSSKTMADSVWLEIPEEEEDDDPRDTPRPTIYGEEVDGPWVKYNGEFEPSQAVWQDDEFFVDKKTKQLTKVNDHALVAELDMVADRWTGVFGTQRSTREFISMQGTSTYSTWTKVKFQLRLKQYGQETVLWTQPKATLDIPIDGPAGPEQSWNIFVRGYNTSPIPKTFKLKPGKYELVMELMRENGLGTGIYVEVSGHVVETEFPRVNIVPAYVSSTGDAKALRTLKQNSNTLVVKSKEMIEALLPVPNNSVVVKGHPMQSMVDPQLSMYEKLKQKLDEKWNGTVRDTFKERYNRVLTHMVNKYATKGNINPGGKVVVLLLDEDFEAIYKYADGTVAFAPHQKVVFVRHDENESSVVHELIHTIQHLWSGSEMIDECEKTYHNSKDNNYGNGCIVKADGTSIKKSKPAIMGSASDNVHVTQCSYWHLVKELQSKPDPKFYLIQGLVYQDGEIISGVLGNAYETMGVDGVPQGEVEAWGIQLKDKNGKTLGSFPIQPAFKDSEDRGDLAMVAINVRIPRLTGTAKIELIGPTGLLDTLIVSKSKPKLKIVSPANNSAVTPEAGKLRVEWEASDADGDALTYLVYYSPDGVSWRTIAYETTETFVEMDVYGFPTEAAIKVLATDGVRTTERTVRFRVARP